jgi:hypothetical protein
MVQLRRTPLVLPPDVARRFFKDLRAFLAEKNTVKADGIAVSPAASRRTTALALMGPGRPARSWTQSLHRYEEGRFGSRHGPDRRGECEAADVTKAGCPLLARSRHADLVGPFNFRGGDAAARRMMMPKRGP